MSQPNLLIVGVGFDADAHLNDGTRQAIEGAEDVFLVLGDSSLIARVRRLKQGAEILPFQRGPLVNYSVASWHSVIVNWCDRVLSPLLRGRSVCVVFQGHPAIGLSPAHVLGSRARAAGFSVRMLPAVSAADVLYACLGFDPLSSGCQHFDAMDFLVRPRDVSASTPLILWQVGIIGAPAQGRQCIDQRRFTVLCSVLSQKYGPNHEVILFEITTDLSRPTALRVPLRNLVKHRVTECSTLFVPPLATPDIDATMLDRLKLSAEQLPYASDFLLPVCYLTS